MSDEGFPGIFQTESPILFDPVKLAIRPDPEPELVAAGVIFFAHIRIVDIPQAIILIKSD